MGWVSTEGSWKRGYQGADVGPEGGPTLQALLGMSQSSSTLTEAESLGTKVLCVATCEWHNRGWWTHWVADYSLITQNMVYWFFKPQFAEPQSQNPGVIFSSQLVYPKLGRRQTWSLVNNRKTLNGKRSERLPTYWGSVLNRLEQLRLLCWLRVRCDEVNSLTD